MSDKAKANRFRSREFAINERLLRYAMYRPLLEGKRLPVHARLFIGLDVSALVLTFLLLLGAIVLGDNFHAVATETNMLTVVAFLLGLHLDPSRAASSFGRGAIQMAAALVDDLALRRRKRDFDDRCARIGAALSIKSDYRAQRVKIWLEGVVSAHGFSQEPVFVRETLLPRTTQTALAHMELAERMETTILQLGASDPAAVLRTALKACAWMDSARVEQAVDSCPPIAND